VEETAKRFGCSDRHRGIAAQWLKGAACRIRGSCAHWIAISCAEASRGTWAWILIVGFLVNGLGWWIWAQLGVDSPRWTSAQFNEAAGSRLTAALQLLSYTMANPVTLLVGLGNSSAFHFVGIYPHITGLEVLAEEGLLGSGLYVGLLIVAARSTCDSSGLRRLNKTPTRLMHARH